MKINQLAFGFGFFLLLCPNLLAATVANSLQTRIEVDHTRHPGEEETRKVEALRAENLAFLVKFRSLPPQERVELWKESNEYKYRRAVVSRVSEEIHALLIAEGADAAPYLAAIVRNKHEIYFYRFWAMSILFDMDRYIPEDSLPRGAYLVLFVKQLNVGGTVDPFLSITGKRIGTEGLAALEWAANEADDKELKFFARLKMGLVEQELNALPLDDLFRRWRDGVRKCTGAGGRPEDFVTTEINNQVIERMPESLAPIIEILNNDRDECVQRNSVAVLKETDLFKVRLRGLGLGRQAIEAVQQAFVQHRIKRECDKCESPEEIWAKLSAQFYKDDFGFCPDCPGSYYAEMLHTLYGENTITIDYAGDIKREWAIPGFNAFITFLTNKDPLFPSWEYTHLGWDSTEAFHPGYLAKMSRIEEAWKQFQAERHVSPATR